MASDMRNVFVSHIHEDDAGLENLKALLAKNGMDVRDYSITSDKQNNAKAEDYIKTQILAPRIMACSALVVYLTRETKQSKWVNWEIEYAHKHGKTIVGVYEWGSKGCDLPEALEEYGDAIVPWNSQQIIKAINGEYKGFCSAGGEQTNRPVPIRRHPC